MFVESVLRYGLPVNFVCALIKPKPGSEDNLHNNLAVRSLVCYSVAPCLLTQCWGPNCGAVMSPRCRHHSGPSMTDLGWTTSQVQVRSTQWHWVETTMRSAEVGMITLTYSWTLSQRRDLRAW